MRLVATGAEPAEDDEDEEGADEDVATWVGSECDADRVVICAGAAGGFEFVLTTDVVIEVPVVEHNDEDG